MEKSSWSGNARVVSSFLWEIKWSSWLNFFLSFKASTTSRGIYGSAYALDCSRERWCNIPRNQSGLNNCFQFISPINPLSVSLHSVLHPHFLLLFITLPTPPLLLFLIIQSPISFTGPYLSLLSSCTILLCNLGFSLYQDFSHFNSSLVILKVSFFLVIP